VREAAIVAVEAVDLSIGRLLPVVRELEGALVVTADHGNADEMYELDKKTCQPIPNGRGGFKAKTSHTLNRVPCYVYAPSIPIAIDARVESPGLANLAATLLQLMGYQAPEDYLPSILQS
jgi:2,3-bisphosphoglycerate-independent phosphoglycerate mutase